MDNNVTKIYVKTNDPENENEKSRKRAISEAEIDSESSKKLCIDDSQANSTISSEYDSDSDSIFTISENGSSSTIINSMDLVDSDESSEKEIEEIVFQQTPNIPTATQNESDLQQVPVTITIEDDEEPSPRSPQETPTASQNNPLPWRNEVYNRVYQRIATQASAPPFRHQGFDNFRQVPNMHDSGTVIYTGSQGFGSIRYSGKFF